MCRIRFCLVPLVCGVVRVSSLVTGEKLILPIKHKKEKHYVQIGTEGDHSLTLVH